MAASNAELTQQVLQLSVDLGLVRTELSDATAELHRMRANAGDRGSRDKKEDKELFLDKKRRTPENWKKSTIWREFAENFVEWVSGIDAEAGDKLEAAIDIKTPSLASARLSTRRSSRRRCSRR